MSAIQNVYLNVGKEKAIIKAAPEENSCIGDELKYFISREDLHFFDAKTEDIIEE